MEEEIHMCEVFRHNREVCTLMIVPTLSVGKSCFFLMHVVLIKHLPLTPQYSMCGMIFLDMGHNLKLDVSETIGI